MMSETKKGSNKGLLYGILIIAILEPLGFFLYEKNKTNDVIEKKDAQYAVLDSSKNQVQREFDDALLRLDAMTGSNSKLDSIVKTKDQEIVNIKARIQSLVRKQNASSAELSEARNLISQLNGKIDGYMVEIERLQTENGQLNQDKSNLTVEKADLEQNLNVTKSAKIAAEEKVNIGSTLHASNFNIKAIDIRRSGKEKATSSAKSADKLRISFDLDENMIATSGQKELYIIVTNPAGNPVAEVNGTVSKFNTKKDGEKPYTSKILVDYETGVRKNVGFDVQQTDKFEQGSYKVEVYQNGFKIGENILQLKKGGIFG
jgi:TolA-binding protein